ncbi:MAG: NAD(P)-dependent oxidoreductase [Chitinophagia bacterium]|nr:NAD(P)-dependent oxidoreductase [Chitinophagia bacterium]
MYKLLITGADGMVGSHLCRQLQSLNFSYTKLTRSNGDITNEVTWQSIEPSNIVIHLAARTFVPDSWKYPVQFVETNTIGTLQALEYCRKHDAKLIYISSYLYGNPASLPIPETATLYTPNPYALSKKMAEDYCRFYHNSFKVPVTILRPFNLYGEGQDNQFLIPMLIQQSFEKEAFRVKDLLPRRDYLYIDDFVKALISCISLQGYHELNIGAGMSYSVQDIINTIQQIQQTNLPVVSEEHQRPNEIMDTVADISEAKKHLNWQPDTSLESGLRRMIAHYQSLANG